MAVLYAQTTQVPIFAYFPPAPIPGLSLTLPEGVGEQVIVTLNVPSSWTSSSAGASFGISIDGQSSPISATYNASPQVHVPTTLVVGVSLTMKPQTVIALAGSCVIDGVATLSAIMA
jgi:hypothetical protein